jgi:hypothetical protein
VCHLPSIISSEYLTNVVDFIALGYKPSSKSYAGMLYITPKKNEQEAVDESEGNRILDIQSEAPTK